MAEIKSTLELALERADAMSMSRDEIDEYRRNEVNEKVGAVVDRYLDGELRLKLLAEALDEFHGREAELAAEAAKSKLVEKLALDNWQRVLAALAELPMIETPANLEKARKHLREMECELEERLADTESQSTEGDNRTVLESLARRGIRGSAVVIGRREQQARTLHERQMQAFQTRLDAVRELLSENN